MTPDTSAHPIPAALNEVLEHPHLVFYEGEGAKTISWERSDERWIVTKNDSGDFALQHTELSGTELSSRTFSANDFPTLAAAFVQDIPEGLRRGLVEKRRVEYEDWGEKKVVSVDFAGRTYQFQFQWTEGQKDWQMEVLDSASKRTIHTNHLREPADIKFLETTFHQDISPHIRENFERNGQYKEDDDGSFVELVTDDGILRLKQVTYEYAFWALAEHDQKGAFLRENEIREQQDIEFAVALFAQKLDYYLLTLR